MTPAELFTHDLTNLIRTYDEDTVADATTLATRILAPVKSELDRATHKFSTELFITATLYVVLEDREPTLRRVLECIVDPAWETEQKMLFGITSSKTHTKRRLDVLTWFKQFRERALHLSTGTAQRMVLRCYQQWSKAFNLPVLIRNEKTLHAPKEKAIPASSDTLSLEGIRIGTRFELADATKLATKILKCVRDDTDETTYEYAHELFIAVVLTTAHTKRLATLKDVLEFMVDPAWDNERKILKYIENCSELEQQAKTKSWVKVWSDKVFSLPYGTTISLIKHSHNLWQQACLAKDSATVQSENPDKSPVPQSGIQVFNMAAVSRALTMMCDLKDEKKGAGERLLKCAQMNNGYRPVPDVRSAEKTLEKAKSQFENLIEPISHLQNDLVLAAAMKAENFRVTPILLLGDPGIGKTFLATALAKGLGGTTEKMSAGAAQGGFQLNGSHSSWNSARYGQVFKALAEGKTASPVFVIDEIDKIGSDERYPILPVLLDLFEPNTARQFTDVFLEMDFDASRIIYILTANSIDTVPEPLLSRVEVFNVPRPEPAQRLRIIQSEAKQLREATGKEIKLDRSTSQQLAERMDIDLRKTTRIVRDAFTNAMRAEVKLARLMIPEAEGRRGGKTAYSRSEIGFC